MENFPQVAVILQGAAAGSAQVSQVVQAGLDGTIGRVRTEDAVKKLKQTLQQLSSAKSDIEEYPDMGDDAQKKASQDAASQLAQSLYSLTQSIVQIREAIPDEIASELKSTLEEFEKVEQSYDELTKAHGGSIDNYLPGLSHRLKEGLDNAYDKVGGR